MLIHIRPHLYSQFLTAEIVDLSVEQLGLKLQGGVDLTTKSPYPNKKYYVASRKIGRKAMDGILIETNDVVKEFTMVAHWLHSYGSVVEHVVHYRVLDNEFDAISDDATMWNAMSASLGGWQSRWPQGAKPNPLRYEHVMALEPQESSRELDLEFDLSGIVCFREETFPLPTLERERVLGHIDATGKKLVPSIEHAFRIGV